MFKRDTFKTYLLIFDKKKFAQLIDIDFIVCKFELNLFHKYLIVVQNLSKELSLKVIESKILK